MRVRGLGREAAAEVALAGEDLIMGRDDPRLRAGGELELDARAAQLGAADALLDDAAGGQALEIDGHRHAGRLELHGVEAQADAVLLVARARRRKPGELDDRVALAGDARVELDDDLPELGLGGPQPRDRLDRVGTAGDPL